MERGKLNPLIVALDVSDANEAFRLIEQLDQPDLFVKVGFRLFCTEGPQLITKLVSLGVNVFIDLKLHDIPNTVKEGVRALTSLGVRMLTVHCAGGLAMLKAAREGVEQACGQSAPPLLVGVTQLTSTSQQVMNEEIGIPGSIEQTVQRYARLAQQAGLDGVVCSVKEVSMLKQVCGTSFVTVTPGIRPLGLARDDQVRVSTPQEALQNGSDFLVVGRPIIQGENPRAAYEAIYNEIRKVGLK
jgi:orotidine-5'-phosphate decarboxylase